MGLVLNQTKMKCVEMYYSAPIKDLLQIIVNIFFSFSTVNMERLETDDGGGAERPEKDVNKAEYYISQLNSNNAKKVALCLVLGFIFYHGLIHLRYGEFDSGHSIVIIDFSSIKNLNWNFF